METWKSAQRVQERRLWHTLFCVGVVLTVTLAASIVVAAGSGAPAIRGWFYVQQSVLLVLGAGGTAVAFRRWRSFRVRG
jgi:uncharacterized membrane protein